MAEHLSKAINAVTIKALTVIVLTATAGANAQSLPDPTRPPALTATEQGDAPTPSGPELQSVLISPTRKLAIISGQRVALGEKFGDARVVRITESEVVLRSGKDEQVLKLFPNIEKQASRGIATSKGIKRPQSK